MEKPTDKRGVGSSLGMITYQAKWIPDLCSVTDPLRQLLIEKNEWQWDPVEEKSTGRSEKVDILSTSVAVPRSIKTNQAIIRCKQKWTRSSDYAVT